MCYNKVRLTQLKNNKITMLKNIFKIRLILWLVLLSVTGCILYLSVVPNGEITYSYDFSKPDKHIKELRPKERLEIITNNADTTVKSLAILSLWINRDITKTAKNIAICKPETRIYTSPIIHAPLPCIILITL